MEDANTPGRKRIWLRRALRLVGAAIVLLALVVLFWLRGALYHRFVSFPREEAAWQALRAQRQPVPGLAGLNDYRGILHSHSKYSHDSEVPFEEILRVLKSTGIDFICLSDHPIQGRADFNLQWRGLHEGKLFVPGFEMKEGIMPFGVASGVVLSNQTDSATLARQISENGGLMFYAHPEEPRDWDCPELVGMEIYNIHTDFKRSSARLRAMVPDLLVNQRRYPEHVFRTIFVPPVDFLRHWDELRRLFHFQLDPYERSGRFVNTHVLARSLSEPTILDGLRAGRVFIGFDMIANSSGFQWFAADGTNQTVMGETAPFSPATRLAAKSPLPCRFTIIKNGSAVYHEEGRALDWAPSGPGKYRVEAALKVLDKWVPWVYANPIELR
jgi:hypothetical protein